MIKTMHGFALSPNCFVANCKIAACCFISQYCWYVLHLYIYMYGWYWEIKLAGAITKLASPGNPKTFISILIHACWTVPKLQICCVVLLITSPVNHHITAVNCQTANELFVAQC
jgi:hypothetical protein